MSRVNEIVYSKTQEIEYIIREDIDIEVIAYCEAFREIFL